MTAFQKIIKYLAIAFAVFLTVSIIGGILSMFGLLGGFIDRGSVTEDIKTYTINSKIDNLVIKINAADLTIKQSDKFAVESNLKHLSVEENNGVLHINETKRFGSAYKGAVLTLYIPANTVFENASISTGAGRLNADDLSADKIDFELGAGEVTINSLIALTDADINGGAGRITISAGALRNLDLDMGVGQLNLTSALTGKSKLDLGIGESNITVIGKKDDYTLDIEKGLGNITLDGTGVSNIKNSGSGQNNIDIDGGIGSINLNFNGN